MTTTPAPFEVLFCFENALQLVIEIKRTDIQSEDKSRIYYWLNISKKTGTIETLSFRSMDNSETTQVRTFAEGTLEWDANTARFNNEKLAPVDVQHVGIEWLERIAGLLV